MVLKIKKRYEYAIYACSALFFPGFALLLGLLMLTALYMSGFSIIPEDIVNTIGTVSIVLILAGGVPCVLIGILMVLDTPKEGTDAGA